MLIEWSISLHYLTNLLENEKGGTSKIGLNCQFCRKLPLFYNWVDKNIIDYVHLVIISIEKLCILLNI